MGAKRPLSGCLAFEFSWNGPCSFSPTNGLNILLSVITQPLKDFGRSLLTKGEQVKSILRLRRGLALAVAALVVMGSQFAGAQVIGEIYPAPPSQPGAPVYPPNPGYPGYNNDVVTVNLNQQFNGFSSLDVDGAFRYATQGREIVGLTIRMAGQGRSQATLLVNGVPAGRSSVLSPYVQDYSFDLSRSYPGARLELRMNGQVYVQSMTAQLAYRNPYPPYPPSPRPPRPPYPNPGQETLSQYVNQHFTGTNNLSLDYWLGLDRYVGRRVNKVIIRARTQRGQGRAVLLVNGTRDGMSVPVSNYTQDYNFFPSGNGRIGYEIRDLSVQIIGNFTVESVSVELARY